MKETGIIMSGDHPKLILEGKKTQTRRVIKPQPRGDVWFPEKDFHICTMPRTCSLILSHCPYGGVGDRLWVRETWSYGAKSQQPDEVIYKADGTPLPNALARGSYSASSGWGKWSPSIFMPRWASRILLEITEVRAERLQEITTKDCFNEGIKRHFASFAGMTEERNPIYSFHLLWDSLNAKREYGWEKNPWVWVIGFKAALQSEKVKGHYGIQISTEGRAKEIL